MLALIDCDCFYVSCERLFNPKIRKSPVVVLSNNDGCVVSRSQEAKALGIQMAEPYFQKKELYKRQGVIAYSSNYALYGDISERVMNRVAKFGFNLENYSIDECFIELNQVSNYNEYAALIRKTVLRDVGIPTKVGVAITKTLTKIAAQEVKSKHGVNGVRVLIDEGDTETALKRTDVADVWGVGRQYTKFLKSHCINTAYDLRNADDKWIKRHMTVVGLRTVLSSWYPLC